MNKNATPFKWQGKNRDRGGGAGGNNFAAIALTHLFCLWFCFTLFKTFILRKTALLCFTGDPLYTFTTIFFKVINYKCISSDSRSSNFHNFPLETSRLQRLGQCAPNLKLTPRSLKKSCYITSQNKSRTLAIPEVSIVLQNNPWIVPFLSNSYLGQKSKYIFRMSCQAPSSIGHGRFSYFRDSTTRT